MLSWRNRHFLLLDLLLFFLTAVLAFELRLDARGVARYREMMAWFLVMSVPIKFLIFRLVGLYSRYWRYASVDELLLIATAVGLSTLVLAALFLAGSLLWPEAISLPRSIPFIDGLLTVLAVGGPRLAVRVAYQRHLQASRRNASQGAPVVPRHVLIAGAGDAGALIVKEMQANPQLGLLPVGFVDDDPAKHGVRIYGVPVLGGRERIPELVEKRLLDEVIIAIPTAPGQAIRQILDLCERSQTPVRIFPGIYNILSGQAGALNRVASANPVGVAQIREVDIEDLLQRAPVQVDLTAVEQMLRGRCVLVTGAGGSIGSELCRQIARCVPSRLILLGHGENSIFAIANELKRDWPLLHTERVIADVRDLDRLCQVFEAWQPQVVFHAAAHKHVSLMENNLQDAVTNNVLGTANVLHVSEQCGVERFVLISTDKVVNPSSVMGATKRVAELLVQTTARRCGRPFVAVRFGNVLGSRGSVVPLFREQIARGGPVTVTHPEVRRYFMTIPEAVLLVLQAAVLGRGKEVFMLDMGEPVRILDLAQDLIKLSGLQPRVSYPGQQSKAQPLKDWEIEIVFTGLGPGEKLFEELSVEGEAYVPTPHAKVFCLRNGDCGGPVSDHFEWDVEQLIALARNGDDAAIRAKLQEIVPRYTFNGESSARCEDGQGFVQPDEANRPDLHVISKS